MAYFACSKAARTGTDKSTRASIAKGLVSPTFTNTSGQKILRGVVQADIVTGRDTGYVTGQSITERLASALRGVTSSGSTARASVSRSTPPASTPAQLYQGDEGVIKTSTTLGMSKTVIVAVIAVIVVVAVALRG